MKGQNENAGNKSLMFFVGSQINHSGSVQVSAVLKCVNRVD